MRKTKYRGFSFTGIVKKDWFRNLLFLEKYSRGRRGAPAKGIGRSRGARVQIPLSPVAAKKALKKVKKIKKVVDKDKNT